jgi:SNF2 family DNA or RNA helicase
MREFKDRYAVWTERNGYPQWLRNKPQEMAQLRKLLHEEAFAITRDECYDLPPELPPEIHLIELEESGKYYDQMAEEMVAMLKSGEFTWAKIPLVQRLRLQQLTSGIAKTEPTDDYPEGRLVRVGREKLRFLEDRLVDQFEADEKVVIGARFHGDIQGIQAVCKKLKVPSFELSGRVSRADRTTNIETFRKIDGAAAFIAQPAAGSLGIDLSTAATMIWYSLVDSWVDYEQFRDRIALSPRATRYIYLLARGTIDELKYESLQEDGDVAKAVTESPNRLLRNFKNESVR